jgi:protein-disulfide isomerase
MRNILIVAGGAVAVAAIALAVWFGTRPTGPAPAPVAVQTAPDKKALLAVLPNDHVMGDAKAPILMIEYASFTCPHCASFHTQILPELKKKWIDTGKVKLVYRDFPLDKVAAQAAQLAECAPKDRYFPIIDMIFRTQGNWATQQDPIGALATSLRIAGVGEAEAKACLANNAIADAVIADYRGGETVGVSSTPTIFVNGEMLKGGRSVDEFDALLTKLAK